MISSVDGDEGGGLNPVGVGCCPFRFWIHCERETNISNLSLWLYVLFPVVFDVDVLTPFVIVLGWRRHEFEPNLY